MLPDVVPYLRCPHCRTGLTLDAGSLGCAAGHRFDVARQGYVSLLPGDAHTGTADTAAMVAARAAVQTAGHFDPVADALADAVGEHLDRADDDGAAGAGLVLDVGAGPGHYLARVLDAAPRAVGLALDVSKYAARRAARAHPRAGAVVADAWRPLPVADHVATAVLNVFAPRDATGLLRVLHPDGLLAVVVPASDHLAELARPLGLLHTPDDKAEALRQALAPGLRHTGTRVLRYRRRLTHDEVRAVAGMGPSARHTDPAQVAAAVAALPEPQPVTVSVHLMIFRPG